MNLELNQFRNVDVVLDKANDNFIQKQFVSAGDKDGRSLTVQITENGAVGEVIGLTLNLRWHNEASGLTDLSAFYVVDRATSVFKIDYPQNMLTPGKVVAYIQILHGGKVTHTKPFEITVQNLAGTTKGVLATAEYGALVTTLAKANEFETEIAEVSAQLQQTDIRIDNIIATPTTVSEQEIIDSRQGAASLGANLTDIKNKKVDKLVVKNSILNGNFVDDTNWTTSLATSAVLNNEMKFTASALYGSVYQKQPTNTIPGHKYYVASDVKATSPLVKLQLYRWAGGSLISENIGHSGGGTYERLSTIATATASEEFSVRIIDNRTSGWEPISIKKFMLVNLTAIYGSGNEPSLAEFENTLLKYTGSSLFLEDSLITNIIVGELAKPPATDKSLLPLYVSKTGNNISLISKYNETSDLRIRLDLKGANNIFNIYDLYTIPNVTDSVSRDATVGTSLGGHTTDWLGPYVVWAETNIDGDMPGSYHFTGGNHGYDGGPTGIATGRTTNVQLFVDGRKKQTFSGFATYVDIYWTNRIQATNTKKADGSGREVLQENYHAHYDGDKLTIDCLIETFEKVTIITYYGIQASIPAWNDFVFFHSSQNRKWSIPTTNPTSGTKTTNLATLRKGSNYLDVAIDNSVGIGDREGLSTGDGCFVSNNKVYFNLLKSKTLESLDVLSYSGYYRFYSK